MCSLCYVECHKYGIFGIYAIFETLQFHRVVHREFKNTFKLPGGAATFSRYGGTYGDYFVVNFVLSLAVYEF